MARKGSKKGFAGDANDPDGLVVWAKRFLESQRIKNYSERTVFTTEANLRAFIEWAFVRGIYKPSEVSKPMLETYQRWLFYYRRKNGKPIGFSSQRVILQKLKLFFRFLARQNAVVANPASDLELPRIERRLPRAILTEAEIEKVMAQADLTDALGLRDRAIMETLYSTGVRRFELAGIQLVDLDAERKTVTVRQGKGKRDRTVPIGARALHWIRRYLDEVRPGLALHPDGGVLFLNEQGEALSLGGLTNSLKAYVEGAEVGKTGAVHIFRHTMATLLLEGGADVRSIQEMLGHAELSTTTIYTRVSIQRLQRVHEECHPGASLAARKVTDSSCEEAVPPTEESLLEALEQEAADEDESP
jgi:integrase/recombinase XerD